MSIYGVCLNCLYFDEEKQDCKKKNKTMTEILKRESWPGLFEKDKCIKCSEFQFKNGFTEDSFWD